MEIAGGVDEAPNIFPTYKNNGYDIVLDVNSGAIHVVDDVTYDVIEMIDQCG